MTANAKGEFVQTGHCKTHYHEQGQGQTVILLHGSGPGVTAAANWRTAIPSLAENYNVIAYDLVGFGYTEYSAELGFQYLDTWTDQLLSLLNAKEIAQADLIGNSFGGAVAISFAAKHPDRVRKLVLMGSGGPPQALTAELDELWGYQPSRDNMARLLKTLVFDEGIVTDQLIDMRMAATSQGDIPVTLEHLFPAPRQRWLDISGTAEAKIRALPHQTLIVHGRDDRVVPMEGSLTLLKWIPNSRLLAFAKCGHWVMMERNAEFLQATRAFLNDA